MDGYEPARIESEVTLIRQIVVRIEVMILMTVVMLAIYMFFHW
jgi:hypothetical protein